MIPKYDPLLDDVKDGELVKVQPTEPSGILKGDMWLDPSGIIPATDHSMLSNLAYADSGHTGFEPAKGADDNYVTDAEKAVLANTSGTNTGDQVADGVTITGTGTAGDPFVGSSGTTDHSALSNLDYASSGHTGFAPTTAVQVGEPTATTGGLWYDTDEDTIPSIRVDGINAVSYEDDAVFSNGEMVFA